MLRRASVDLDTDVRIQKTIQSEFKGRTLICIAHRLRTILAYDRVLVMDSGQVTVRIFVPVHCFDYRAFCGISNTTTGIRFPSELVRFGRRHLS